MHSHEIADLRGLSGDFERLSASMRRKLANDEAPQAQTDSHSHACGVCSKRFKRTEHLKRHARSHDPGPYLPCNICERSFLRRLVRTVMSVLSTTDRSPKATRSDGIRKSILELEKTMHLNAVLPTQRQKSRVGRGCLIGPVDHARAHE